MSPAHTGASGVASHREHTCTDGHHHGDPPGTTSCIHCEGSGNFDSMACSYTMDENDACLGHSETQGDTTLLAHGYAANEDDVHLQGLGTTSNQDTVLYTNGKVTELLQTRRVMSLWTLTPCGEDPSLLGGLCSLVVQAYGALQCPGRHSTYWGVA